jgi:hypothetical protein
MANSSLSLLLVMMVMVQSALCGIKEAGGITIAQKPDPAAQPDMRGKKKRE